MLSEDLIQVDQGLVVDHLFPERNKYKVNTSKHTRKKNLKKKDSTYSDVGRPFASLNHRHYLQIKEKKFFFFFKVMVEHSCM